MPRSVAMWALMAFTAAGILVMIPTATEAG